PLMPLHDSIVFRVCHAWRLQRRLDTPPIKRQRTDGHHERVPWRGNPAARVRAVAADEGHDENEDEVTDQPIAGIHVALDLAFALRILVDKGKIENDGRYDNGGEQ